MGYLYAHNNKITMSKHMSTHCIIDNFINWTVPYCKQRDREQKALIILTGYIFF